MTRNEKCRDCLHYKPAMRFPDEFGRHYYARCNAFNLASANMPTFADIAFESFVLCDRGHSFVSAGDVYAWHSVAQLLESSHGQS